MSPGSSSFFKTFVDIVGSNMESSSSSSSSKLPRKKHRSKDKRATKVKKGAKVKKGKRTDAGGCIEASMSSREPAGKLNAEKDSSSTDEKIHSRGASISLGESTDKRVADEDAFIEMNPPEADGEESAFEHAVVFIDNTVTKYENEYPECSSSVSGAAEADGLILSCQHLQVSDKAQRLKSGSKAMAFGNRQRRCFSLSVIFLGALVGIFFVGSINASFGSDDNDDDTGVNARFSSAPGAPIPNQVYCAAAAAAAANFTKTQNFDEEFGAWASPYPSSCPCCTKSSHLSLPHGRSWHTSDEPPDCKTLSRSFVNAPNCGGKVHHNIFKLLVTCTGRSGSTFVSRFLSGIGFKVAHDEVAGPHGYGAVAWRWLFNADSFETRTKSGSIGHKNCLLVMDFGTGTRFENAVHLVRHPLKSIRSRWSMGAFKMLMTENNFYRPTFCNTHMWNDWPKSLPTLRHPKSSVKPDLLSLVATIRHWVLWNSYAAATAKWGFRLEDFANPNRTVQIVDKLCKIVGANAAECPSAERIAHEHALHVGTYSAHSKKVKEWVFTWDILFQADPLYAVMAQLLALRYGYDVSVQELYPPVFKHFCFGVDKLEWLAKSKHEDVPIVCDLDPDNFPDPDCTMNSNNRWECSLPSHFDFAYADYPKPHFPFENEPIGKILGG